MENIVNVLNKIHFTNFAWMLILPAAMMAIDVLTGWIGSVFVLKNFQSSIMRSGLIKKAVELLIILLGVLFTYGLGLPTYFLKAISLYIILMELMSILENMDKCGVPLPAFIKNTINNLSSSIQHDDAAALADKVKQLEAALAKYENDGK